MVPMTNGYFVSEAVMALAVWACNPCELLQRHPGWLDRVTAATLRFRLSSTGRIISRTGSRTAIRIALPVQREP